MKKTTGTVLAVLLAAAFAAVAAFLSFRLGETKGRGNEGARPPGMGDITYIDDMGADEIPQYLRGKAFIDYPHASAGWGEIMYFAPQGNEYYWFCGSGDGQSRLRAAYGVWAPAEDGRMVLTTHKLIEREGGRYIGPDASYGTRFVLQDFDPVLTEVNIETEMNIRPFQYVLWVDDETGDVTAYGTGFSGMGDYYCNPAYVDADSLREAYEMYFTLFES